jgi:hypothetical protein
MGLTHTLPDSGSHNSDRKRRTTSRSIETNARAANVKEMAGWVGGIKGTYFSSKSHTARRAAKFQRFCGSEFSTSLPSRTAQMPAPSHFMTRFGSIEVAPQLALSSLVIRGLRRHHAMTSTEIANWAYWGRSPRSKLGAQWWASRSMRSSARRAVARLRRNGCVVVIGHHGRACIYALADADRDQ